MQAQRGMKKSPLAYGVANMAQRNCLMKEPSGSIPLTKLQCFEAVGAQFSVKAYRDMFIVAASIIRPEKLEPTIEYLMLEVLSFDLKKV